MNRQQTVTVEGEREFKFKAGTSVGLKIEQDVPVTGSMGFEFSVKGTLDQNPKEIGFFDSVPNSPNNATFNGSWSNYPYFKSGSVVFTSMRTWSRHRRATAASRRPRCLPAIRNLASPVSTSRA